MGSDQVALGDFNARETILLVEDDDGVRRSLQLLLQGKGYAIRSHASPSALLADPAAREAACLITDYRMDEFDGLAVLRRLRADGWQGPAMLITAFPSAELKAEAREAGFCDIIEKPLLDHALVGAVARILRRPSPDAGTYGGGSSPDRPPSHS